MVQAETRANNAAEGVKAAVRSVQLQLNMIHQHLGASEMDRTRAAAAAVRLKVALNELARIAPVGFIAPLFAVFVQLFHDAASAFPCTAVSVCLSAHHTTKEFGETKSKK